MALHDDGAVACATVLWKFRGRLQLTVVVKALFTIVPDGVAVPAGPAPIVPKDRHIDGHPLRSVEAASDLAPYLARCDVVFVGHAYAPGGRAPAGSVRLGISRDGRLLLDKTLHVFGDRGPATPAGPGAPEPFTRIPIVYEKAVGGLNEPNPIGTDAPNLVDPGDARRPAGFGPISRLWRVRKRLLGKIEPKAMEAPVAEIPDAMPWEFFQAAPPDQQIEHLRGGEWLVLDGLHPTLARVQTRLATVRGAARVVAQRAGAPAAEQAPELACDTLAIDGDRQTFSLTWRGRCEVPDGEAGSPSLGVVAALEAPGVAVDWAKLVAGARPPPAAAPAARAVDLNVTAPAFGGPSAPAMPFATDASAASVLSRLPATPAAARPATTRPKHDKETMALSLDLFAPPPDAVLPFAHHEAHVGTAHSRPPPPPAAEVDDAAGGTMVLGAAQHAAMAGRAAAPFAPQIARPGSVAPAAMPGAPWSSERPAPVRPAVEKDADTAEMPFIDPRLLPPEPALAPAPPPDAAPAPQVIAAPPAAPPASTDPWARAPASPPEPEPQPRPQAPVAFERPAAGAVKGSFYAKFKKGRRASTVLHLDEGPRLGLDPVEHRVAPRDRRRGDGVRHGAGDDRPIGVAVDEAHRHLHAGLQREVHAVAVARVGLGHAHGRRRALPPLAPRAVEEELHGVAPLIVELRGAPGRAAGACSVIAVSTPWMRGRAVRRAGR